MKAATSLVSQLFGKFASKEFSPSLQRIINNGYVRLMGLDMSEFETPESYRSLNALFTRSLKQPRSFSDNPNDMISPCDALISEAGIINDALAMQIKGMRYSIEELLTEHVEKEKIDALEEGSYVNFYLSPRDYHRYHIPLDLLVKRCIYVPGKLYPVNMPALRNIASLFVKNERVVIECASGGKTFFMILVGALNVGKMQVSFEPRIRTNADIQTLQHYTYENLECKKGEDFGCFEMGSTIVILSPKGLFDYSIGIGEKVRFAQTIAKVL